MQMTSLPSSSSATYVSTSRQHILQKLDFVLVRIVQSAQLRTHKYFRVAVPQAITGQALVQHIQEVLSVEDTNEALHFATILLHFGYLFPVIDVHSQAVREDNTLYRIQLPYFWPSHAHQADNVEYAIYLTKRLMRSEQKHGLEQEEIDAYNKLVELLGHMWGFITAQAELQLKTQKERRKADKVVFDSEERAFWRLRRPGIQNAALEEHIQKTERRLKKCSASYYKTTIARLKNALKTKPWLKVMKASETMTNWSEQFQEYDPFITQPHPTNPWVSDDPSLWALNADNVEVPTERRVKRWGLSVMELVRDPIGRQVLESFLDSEFSSENLRFWCCIQDLKLSPNCQVEAKGQHILEEFLAPGAPCQVNVDSRTLEETLQCLRESDQALRNQRFAFSVSEEHVFTLMSKDSYPRFLRSGIYKAVLDAAKAKGGRKRIIDLIRELSGSAVNTKKVPAKYHKTSRGSADVDNTQQLSLNANNFPKQCSSDSLPVKVGSLGGTSPSLQLPSSGTSSASSPALQTKESNKR
ncbi:hypothetical protein niasHS_003541 [Heterodera schachtii]|uniref:Uncharacterized protein n=1 Tax=Heterodera schachtii TaxID=97005 RepID=A0ABD2KH55_HETSC